MDSFKLYTVDLNGSKLIEAGAGTGKTYTLSGLYIRYIVEKQLLPDQILVVTFTKAATAELKGRLRQQLLECKDHLHGNKSVNPDNKELYALYESYKASEDNLKRINLALACFDQASIFTINGFCQKIIDDFNSDCGSAVLNQLIHTQDYIRKFVYDFWRIKQNEIPAVFQSFFPPIDDIVKKFSFLQSKSHYKNIPPDKPQRSAMDLQTEWGGIKEQWQEKRNAVLDYICDGSFGRKFSVKSRENYNQAITDFLETLNLPVSGTNYMERISPDYLCNESNKLINLNSMPEFINRFSEFYKAVCQLPYSFVFECWENVQIQLQQLLEQEGKYSYSDQIHIVYQAVKESYLSEKAGQQWKCVMVDEFQDTDLMQFEIFDRCFNTPNHSLIYVGDPKQAIYDFRGADVYVYQKAKETVDAVYSLNINWRSSENMLNISNSLFDFNNSFQIESIRFEKSHSKPYQSEQLVDKHSALAIFDCPKDTRKQQLLYELRRFMNTARIRNADSERPILADDIAILVKTNNEAFELYDFLISENFAVTLRTDASIFSTEAAKNVYYLIRAVIAPHKSNIFTALHGLLFQKSLSALHKADSKKLVKEFVALRVECQKQGLARVLSNLLLERKTYQHILQRNDGERHYTDIQHIFELIQQQQDAGRNEQQIEQWLAHQISSPDVLNEEDDSQKRRLESDGRKISIMTIHKSKGLEFSCVFLPYADSIKTSPEKNGKILNSCVPIHDKNNNGVIDWSGRTGAVDEYKKEKEAESIRLLYVAVTRAKYQFYLGLDLSHGNSKKLPVNLLLNQLNNVADHVIDIPEYSEIQQKSEPAIELSFQAFKGNISRPQSVYSFSYLSKSQLQYIDNVIDNTEDKTDYSNFFFFPKGAKSGSMQHKILENLRFNASHEEIKQESEAQLSNFDFDEKWLDCLTLQMQQVLNVRLFENGFSLSEVKNKIVEMEFLLPVSSVKKSTIADWLGEHRGNPVDFHHDHLYGFLTGFIDLIIELEGVFYVIDYKSNYLGNKHTDYNKEELRSAIEHHYYDLQYLLYTAAVVKLLQQRLSGFDYSKHFGGVAYIFTRGVDAQMDGQGIYFNKPRYDLIQQILKEFEYAG